MSSRNFSAWSADGKPSRADIGFAVVALLWAAVQFSAIETVSWGWIAVGFVAWAIGLGPVAASATGKRIGAWFRAIGVAGRTLAILGFFVAVWMAATTVSVPTAIVTNFVIGGFVAMFVVTAVETIRDRTMLG